MQKKRGKVERYILYFFFFFLAGALQWISSSVSGTWLPFLLQVLANAIFFALVLFWAFSVQRRMPDKRSRYLLSGVATLLLAFLVMRFSKYNLVKGEAEIERYLFYAFLIPELFVPLLALIVVLPMRRRRAVGLVLSLLCSAFIFLTFTNDLHHLVYTFPGGEHNSDNHGHGWLFYPLIATVIAMILSFILCLAYRCKKQGSKRLFALPLVSLVLVVALNVIFFLFPFPAYKSPELMCFSFLVVFESCIVTSLFPSNDNYASFFTVSSVKALIIDEKKTIIAKSKEAVLPSLQEKNDALEKPIFLEGNIRLRSAKIRGGWVLIEDDLSSIKDLENTLLANRQELVGEQDLLLYENEIKGKEAAIKEKKEIFKTINRLSKSALPDISSCLAKAREGDYAKHVSEALLRLAYLKRKANILLMEGESIPVEELGLAIKESLNYLPCLSSFRLIGKGNASKASLLKIYDDFELIVTALPDESYFLLDLKKDKNIVTLRFFFSSEVVFSGRLNGRKKEKKGEEGHLLELVYTEGKA